MCVCCRCRRAPGLVNPRVTKVVHPLLWFDKAIFRAWGSLLPPALWGVRLGAAWLLAAAYHSKEGGACGGSTTTSTTGGSSGSSRLAAGAAAGLVPKGGAAARWAVGLNAHVFGWYGAMTLGSEAAVVYLLVTWARLGVYGAHLGGLALQQGQEHFMSDHLMLAASLLACLQSEMVCCVSDLQKATGCVTLFGCAPAAAASRPSGSAKPPTAAEPADSRRPTHQQQQPVGAVVKEAVFCAVFVLNATAFALTTLDMYHTSRYFHTPGESAVSLVAGAALFQAPVLAWLSARRRRHSRVTAATLNAVAAPTAAIDGGAHYSN